MESSCPYRGKSAFFFLKNFKSSDKSIEDKKSKTAKHFSIPILLYSPDCKPRILNHEKYWNNSSCIDALAYGQICTNLSSKDECQYMTHRTHCGGSKPYKCQCYLSEYFNIVNKTCENLLSINETCTQIDACKTGNCIGPPFKCQCQSIEFFNLTTNQCEIIIAPKTTEPSITTKTATTVDLQSTCLRISTEGIEMWNGSNCINALSYGFTCINSNQCQYLTQNTSCIGPLPNKCQCSLSLYFNYITDKCEDLLSINQSCTQVDGCKTGYCFGVPLTCQCLSTEYYDTGLNKCSKLNSIK